MSQSDRSLTLLRAFCEALSHKVRTPLSTISNQIFVLDPQSVDQDLQLIKKQSLKISEILNSLVSVEVTSRQEKIIQLRLLCEKIGSEGVLTFDSIEEGDELKIQFRYVPKASKPASSSIRSLTEFAAQELSISSIYIPFFDAHVESLGSACTYQAHNGMLLILIRA